MKLIDILVKELPARGGWPDGSVKCCQSSVDSELYFENAENETVFKFRTWCRSIADERIKHGPYFYVTREQYEAAITEPPSTFNCRAHQFLEKGVQHMKDRAAQRDSEDGERSMKATVDAFNAMFGHNLTETQGWQFMVLLKMARSRNKFNPDDYEDGAAYTGLAGEAHSNEQN